MTAYRRIGRVAMAAFAAVFGAAVAAPGREAVLPPSYSGLREINPPESPSGDSVKAIVGALLIDGRGGPRIANSAVVMRGNRIVAVGPRASVAIPGSAEVFDASGLSLLPGLIDAHLHLGVGPMMYEIPRLYIAHGVTTARDPGRPFDVFDPIRRAGSPMPRFFLPGGHFDAAPPAWPDNAVLIEGPAHARATVRRFVARGASAIKVYYRLPLDSIRATCEAAHSSKVPVTAHLELVDADQAVEAGIDEIEHITSLGTALASSHEAERFREGVRASNSAREDGRYRLWAALDLDDSPRVDALLQLVVRHGIFLSPTLSAFERRAGDANTEDVHVRGFEQMMKFTGMCHAAGVTIVVGPHTWGRHTRVGRAFQREMELLVESGLSPAAAIKAATWDNARFLGCSDRLGSIQEGQTADLILVAGDPTRDIRVMYNVNRVMLNGTWTR